MLCSVVTFMNSNPRHFFFFWWLSSNKQKADLLITFKKQLPALFHAWFYEQLPNLWLDHHIARSLALMGETNALKGTKVVLEWSKQFTESITLQFRNVKGNTSNRRGPKFNNVNVMKDPQLHPHHWRHENVRHNHFTLADLYMSRVPWMFCLMPNTNLQWSITMKNRTNLIVVISVNSNLNILAKSKWKFVSLIQFHLQCAPTTNLFINPGSWAINLYWLETNR